MSRQTQIKMTSDGLYPLYPSSLISEIHPSDRSKRSNVDVHACCMYKQTEPSKLSVRRFSISLTLRNSEVMNVVITLACLLGTF